MFIVNGKGWLVPVSAMAAGIVCAIADLRGPRLFWPVVGLSGLVDHRLGTVGTKERAVRCRM